MDTRSLGADTKITNGLSVVTDSMPTIDISLPQQSDEDQDEDKSQSETTKSSIDSWHLHDWVKSIDIDAQIATGMKRLYNFNNTSDFDIIAQLKRKIHNGECNQPDTIPRYVSQRVFCDITDRLYVSIKSLKAETRPKKYSKRNSDDDDDDDGDEQGDH